MLNHNVLFYLKWVDTSNTLKTVVKTWLFWLKMMKCGKNTIKFVIKNQLGIKVHSQPVYEYKYLKAKLREFDGMIKGNLLGNNMPKENMHYTCIACITIDSVLKIDKKSFANLFRRV